MLVPRTSPLSFLFTDKTHVCHNSWKSWFKRYGIALFPYILKRPLHHIGPYDYGLLTMNLPSVWLFVCLYLLILPFRFGVMILVLTMWLLTIPILYVKDVSLHLSIHRSYWVKKRCSNKMKTSRCSCKQSIGNQTCQTLIHLRLFHLLPWNLNGVYYTVLLFQLVNRKIL